MAPLHLHYFRGCLARNVEAATGRPILDLMGNVTDAFLQTWNYLKAKVADNSRKKISKVTCNSIKKVLSIAKTVNSIGIELPQIHNQHYKHKPTQSDVQLDGH